MNQYHRTFFKHAQARELGREVVKGFNEKAKCLIIHEPFYSQDPKSFKKLKTALEEGLGEIVEECIYEPILEWDKSKVSMEEVMREWIASDFNKVLNKHPDIDIVITLVSLPSSEDELYKMDIFKMIEEPENSGVWVRDPKQNYPRLGIFNGSVGNLLPLYSEGLIYAMTMWKPDPIIKDYYSEYDRENAFDLRYLMVTSESLSSLQKQYPKTFPKWKKN